VKSSFWDDRAQITLAGYFGEWEDMLIPESVGYIDDAGDPASTGANSSGGDADVYGIEVEGSALLTDKLLLDATFAWNKTDINKLGSYEGLTLLGDRDLTGLGKEFSRTPETSGSLSLTYTDALNADYDWFARSDYFYRGEMWVSEANLAKTGDSHVFDLRLGMESDKLRLEFYVTNLFEEDEYAGVFPLFDLSGLSGGFGDITAAAASLQPRRAVGARASFSF
jgi:iron complex outermembrane receptor protein